MPLNDIDLETGARIPWSRQTVATWGKWWRDGVATQWSDADSFALTRAIRLVDAVNRGAYRPGIDSELRLTLDGLGLTPKGRLQLRWTYAENGELERPGATPAGVTPIGNAPSRRDPRVS